MATLNYIPVEAEIVFAGIAEIEFSGLAILNYIPDEASILFAGTASSLFLSTAGIRSNLEWTELTPPTFSLQYLWGRPEIQQNSIAARDTGPAVIGDLSDGLLVQENTLTYTSDDGQLTINGTPWDIILDIIKLDFTYDVFGYPVLVYINKSKELHVKFTDQVSGSKIDKLLDIESSEAFICLADRFNGSTENDNNIFIAYLKNNQILTRNFLESQYGIPRKTAVSIDKDNAQFFGLLGLGVTKDNTLILNARYLLNT